MMNKSLPSQIFLLSWHQDGECGFSSYEESPHCWSDGLATFFQNSLKVNTQKELQRLSPNREQKATLILNLELL